MLNSINRLLPKSRLKYLYIFISSILSFFILFLLFIDFQMILEFFDPNGPFIIQNDGTRANMDKWIGWWNLLIVNIIGVIIPFYIIYFIGKKIYLKKSD